MENHAEAPPNPGIVFDMVQAQQRTAALKAAIELDVFRAVGDGPGDVASIARHCAASERGIRILCDFLVINGVLSKDDGRYQAHTIKCSVSRSAIAGVHGVGGAFHVASRK